MATKLTTLHVVDSRFAEYFPDAVVEAARVDPENGQDWVDHWRGPLDETAEFISSRMADRLERLQIEAPPFGLLRRSRDGVVPLEKLGGTFGTGNPYESLKRAFKFTLYAALVDQCAPPSDSRQAGPAYEHMNRLLGLLPLFYANDSWAESHRPRGLYRSIDNYFELAFVASQFCRFLESTPRIIVRAEPEASLEEHKAIAKNSPHFLHLLARRANPPSANGYLAVHRNAHNVPFTSYNIDNFALRRDGSGRGAIRVACDLSHFKVTSTDQHGRRRAKCPASIGPDSAIERMWKVLVDIAANHPALWPATIEIARMQDKIYPLTYAVTSARAPIVNTVGL